MESTNLDPFKQVNRTGQVDSTEQAHSVASHVSHVTHVSDTDHRVGGVAESVLAQGTQGSSEGHFSDHDRSQRHVLNMMEKEIALATFLDENIEEYIDEVDEDGNTGLMRALHTHNTEALKIYCQAGALASRRVDDAGFTPLMLAASQGYTQAIEILLKHDAFINAIDDHGMMALDYLNMSRAFMFQRGSSDLPKTILKELLIQEVCKVRPVKTPQLYKKVRKEWRKWKLAQQGLDAVNFDYRIVGNHPVKPRDVYRWVYEHIFYDRRRNPQSDQCINLNLTIQDIKELLEFCEEHSLNADDISVDDRALLRAMQLNMPQMVNILLKAGADKEASDSRGLRPLMLAAMNGQEDILKVLLNAGANRNAQDVEGRSALMLATISQKHETMRLLLADSATDKELRDYSSKTALLIALRYRSSDDRSPDDIGLSDQTVNLLLDYGVHAECQDLNGFTPLMLAIEQRYPIATDRLLRFYRDKGQLEVRDLLGDTAFIWAARYGNLYAARCLLESGAYIEARNNNGDTGLIRAVEGNHVEMINFMLAPPRSVPLKADIEARNSLGQTALIIAAKYCQREALECLLHAGANVDAATEEMTVLSYAINTGNISIIRCLIQHDVNVNQIDPRTGSTPILRAQLYERRVVNYPRGIPQLLMAAGADPEASEIVRNWVRRQWEADSDWVLDPELNFYEILEIARQST